MTLRPGSDSNVKRALLPHWRKLPVDQALQFGIQIADALAAAHQGGHRRPGPEARHVMHTKAGAKLLDFRVAKPPEQRL